MGLSVKQKNWIIKKRKKLSAKKIAADLNVPEDEVNEFLQLTEKNKPKKLFYLFTLLIPIIFFILLEVSLRIADYGTDTSTWMQVTKTHYGLNFNVARRYFHNIKSVPNSIQDVFKIVKTDKTFRVFVLGGSSGAGYPFMPLGSFSRYVRRRLELMYPESDIEVVNLSLTAVNSYTIRDFVPDVLEQNPDLILIYAGHNEYYGALGVGSMESLGRSRPIVNFVLSINKYKTIELIRNVIKSTVKLFSGDEKLKGGTLMARMAEKKRIPLNSDIYNAGLEQFEGNMDDILKEIKSKNVPVIISTLSCNIKDQKPFISEASGKYPPAGAVYSAAEKKLLSNHRASADSLFRYAKDLDMLRFRAPEKINSIIFDLGNKYHVPVVNVDSAFSALSPDGIAGNNLFIDHLHPSLNGYKQIGRLFYEMMIKTGSLPKTKPLNLSLWQQDSLTRANFYFSPLDSTIAAYKIKLLKNDYPFIRPQNSKPVSQIIQPHNYIDSTAFDFVMAKAEWETTQRKTAAWYLINKDYKSFIKQMNLLINQFPIIVEYYNFAGRELIKIKDYDDAYNFLLGKYKLAPDAFSTKWLGTIQLYRHNTDSAVKYLEESLKIKGSDYQVLYNLAGAYSIKKDYSKSLELVNKCLSINPNYKSAADLKKQLEALTLQN